MRSIRDSAIIIRINKSYNKMNYNKVCIYCEATLNSIKGKNGYISLGRWNANRSTCNKCEDINRKKRITTDSENFPFANVIAVIGKDKKCKIYSRAFNKKIRIS